MISTFYNTASLFFETSLSSPLEPYCHIVHDFGLAGGIDNLKGSTSPRSLKVSLNAKKLGDCLFSPLMNGTGSWCGEWCQMLRRCLSQGNPLCVANMGPSQQPRRFCLPMFQLSIEPWLCQALETNSAALYWKRGSRNILRESLFVCFLVWLNIYLS